MKVLLTTLPGGRFALSCFMALLLVIAGNSNAGEISSSIGSLGVEGIEGLDPEQPLGPFPFSIPVNAATDLIGGNELGIPGLVTVDNRTGTYVVAEPMLSTDSSGIVSGIITLHIFDEDDNFIKSEDLQAFGRARIRRIERAIIDSEAPDAPTTATIHVERIDDSYVEAELCWVTNREPDIAYYKLYITDEAIDGSEETIAFQNSLIVHHSRVDLEDFTCEIIQLSAPAGEKRFVYVTAVDLSGNESGFGGPFSFNGPNPAEEFTDMAELDPRGPFILGNSTFRINYNTAIGVRARFLNLRERQPYFFFIRALNRINNSPVAPFLSGFKEVDNDLQGLAAVNIPRVHTGRSEVSLLGVENSSVGFFVEQDKLQIRASRGLFFGRNAGSVFSNSLGYESGGPFWLIMNWFNEAPVGLGTSQVIERVHHFRLSRSGFHSINRDLGINYFNTNLRHLLFGDDDQLPGSNAENILRGQVISSPAAINVLTTSMTAFDYLGIDPPEDDDPPIIGRQ